MRVLRRHLLLWACAPAISAAAQLAPDPSRASLLIVSSDESQVYTGVAGLITTQLAKAGFDPDAVQQTTAAALAQRLRAGPIAQPRFFVALGVEAATTLVHSRVDAPVLAVLVPRASWQNLLRSSGRRASSRFTALYLDQPLSRQIHLIRLALPHVRRVGVLLGPESIGRLALLTSLAGTHGLTVTEAKVDAEAGVFPALKQVLENCDVLLALADPQVFNSQSIQNILLAALRAKVPMVGFSPAYVRAGALLSLHVTPTQAALQAAALLQAALGDKALPANPVESNDFEVGVNEHVARAMDLTLNAATLRLALRDAEQMP